MASSTPTSDALLGNAMPREKVVASADIYANKPTVKVGPRQVNAAPQATFHYGDGSYLVKFTYKQDAKAAERAGQQESSTTPRDKDKKGEKPKKQPQEGNDKYE